MTTLVTGCAGFIGSHVMQALLARSVALVGVDSFDDYYDPARKRQNLHDAGIQGRVPLIGADIRDSDAMAEVFRRHDVRTVIHLAARPGVRCSFDHAALYTDINVTGTAVLLDCARRFGVQQFVFASSSSVYGARPDGSFGERTHAPQPISPYAVSKRAGELLCETFAGVTDMGISCLRFFTVYGPRQRPDMALHDFARRIERGEPITVYGDGSSARDYTYVGDVVAGILAALEQPRRFRIYNLGSGRPIPLAEAIEVLQANMGRKAELIYCDVPPGDVPYTCADYALARAELGYEPAMPFAEGVAHFVRWYRGRSGSRDDVSDRAPWQSSHEPAPSTWTDRVP